jgi:hypothetical protein
MVAGHAVRGGVQVGFGAVSGVGPCTDRPQPENVPAPKARSLLRTMIPATDAACTGR